MKWIPLTDKLQLEAIMLASEEHKVVLFKHSTRCGISKLVLNRFENDIKTMKSIENVQFYFLDLIAYREISNRVASAFSVPHESPQLIILENGKVTFHTSHADISAAILEVEHDIG